MLLQALDARSDGAHITKQLSDVVRANCDASTEALVRTVDPAARLDRLLDQHWGSALAIALKKLSTALERFSLLEAGRRGRNVHEWRVEQSDEKELVAEPRREGRVAEAEERWGRPIGAGSGATARREELKEQEEGLSMELQPTKRASTTTNVPWIVLYIRALLSSTLEQDECVDIIAVTEGHGFDAYSTPIPADSPLQPSVTFCLPDFWLRYHGEGAKAMLDRLHDAEARAKLLISPPLYQSHHLDEIAETPSLSSSRSIHLVIFTLATPVH
ncbi:hypothetical protein EV121DRAFT_292661 [Schizophyllum commune]